VAVSKDVNLCPKPVPHWYRKLIINFRWTVGLLMFINFMIFWAAPVVIQGQVWKYGLNKPMRRLFAIFDQNKTLRSFAARYIYSKEVYTDFFAVSVLLATQAIASVCLLFYWQIRYKTLPLWLIYAYYFEWVGLGGRGMGGAYTFAHKEGHHRNGGIYRPWIANTVGNFWENWMGFWYGNVPYNFSTSHIFLHHRLNGGKGDSFYQFDLDRSSLSDLFLYLYRILDHMTGASSLRLFATLAADGNKTMRDNRATLLRGMVWYWLIVPAAIVAALAAAGAGGPWAVARFMFFVYLQPLLCMTFFLAFINFGLHGFVEFTPEGEHIPCVNSSVITGGDDDFFGEDDHMAHHYHTAVTHRDLPAHHAAQKEEWGRHVGSCFRDMAIPELSALMLAQQWDLLATKHFTDHSGRLTPAEAAALLRARARRVEMPYAEYEFEFLPALRSRAAALVASGACDSLERAYKHIAHHK